MSNLFILKINDENAYHSRSKGVDISNTLTFTAIDDNCTIKLKGPSITTLSCYTSGLTDWTKYTIGSGITIQKGETLSFKNGKNTFSTSNSNYYYFEITSNRKPVM